VVYGATTRARDAGSLDRMTNHSRFWPFQWIEGGWLFALSLLLIAATIWLVRRRTA
jgi:hypothetical protein